MNFDIVFERVLGSEGKYSNDPDDPGGETNWGISKRQYPNLDIKNLTQLQAKELYLRDFWNPLSLNRYPDGIKFQLFDFAVNSGIQTAIRYLQRAIGVADDGHWGPISQSALESFQAWDVIMNLNAERLDYMTRLKNWPNAGKGWTRRIAQNLRNGALDT